jgi:hypothetical protein
MEENRIPKRVLYMNMGSTRLRDRPRNRWRDEMREDGRTVGGEWWQKEEHNREEALENGKESTHSTHANRMDECRRNKKANGMISDGKNTNYNHDENCT